MPTGSSQTLSQCPYIQGLWDVWLKVRPQPSNTPMSKESEMYIKLGASPQPLNSSLGCQWSTNEAKSSMSGPLSLEVALGQTPSPGNQMLTPPQGQDHSHRLFRFVPEKGIHGFRFCMCSPSVSFPNNAPGHPRVLHSISMGIFDLV